MNSNEKFEQIYSKIVENNFEDLEISRFKAKNETIRNITIIIILIIIGFVLHSFLYKTFYPNDEIADFINIYLYRYCFSYLYKSNAKRPKL